jgi:trans-2-enoyl-CoA reductase
VLSSGPGSNLKAGDWVVPVFPGSGTWRSHVIADSVDFLKVPQVGNPEDIATVMVNPCTAFRMLNDFVDLKPGDVVVQNGATSGVGKAVMQICKARGVKTINIVRSRPEIEATRAHLRELGATVVLEDSQLRDREAVAAALKEAGLEGKKAVLGLNCVSGTSTIDMARLVGTGATIVTYGGMSKKPAMMGTGAFIFSDITMRGFWMTRWNQENGPTSETRLSMLTALFAMIKEGKLKQDHNVVTISTKEDMVRALEEATAPQKGAKVVIKFDVNTKE